MGIIHKGSVQELGVVLVADEESRPSTLEGAKTRA